MGRPGAGENIGGGILHPVVLLYYISPFGFLALLPVAVRCSAEEQNRR
jgi:hypothetical protein